MTAIPGAPSREIAVAFQVSLVERMRAILAFRQAERAGAADRLPALEERIAACTRLVDELREAHDPPFARACAALRLSQRERDALALIAAPHLDDTFRTSIAAYHRSAGRAHVDAALVVDILCLNRTEAIDAAAVYREGGVLHVAGLIESMPVTLPHTPSTLEYELVPTPRLLRLLDGEIGLDPRFHTLARLITTDRAAHEGVVTDARATEIADLVNAFERAHGVSRGAAVLLAGPHGGGKLRLARSLAARIGRARLLVVDSVFLPQDAPRLTRVVTALGYEAELLGARLVLRGVEHVADSPRGAATLLGVLRSLNAPAWATTDQDPRNDEGQPWTAITALTIALPHPDLELRRAAWTAEARSHEIAMSDDQIRDLASEFPITRSAIDDVVGIIAMKGHPPLAEMAKIAEARMRGQLGRYARRSRNRARMEHLVLAENTREQLTELLDAVRHRAAVFDQWHLAERHAVGRGIVALFNGPPGTGKTMAANVIANELDLPLYRIDTSNVVDRYVGETEKNLVRLFDEAAASRAALLFDEADSLFGKRVDAEDSIDRHANMQINVLLNLIEDYDGFVVLTTNMKGALDSAFLRRIIYKIGFDLPDYDERLALWEYHLPPEIPRAEGVDLTEVAEEFDRVSGGDIKNAVLRAALSTRGESSVTQEILRRSMINELRANGSVIADGARGRKPRGSSV